jgi:hypothetical protein
LFSPSLPTSIVFVCDGAFCVVVVVVVDVLLLVVRILVVLLVVADDDTVLSLTVRLGGVLDVPSEVVVCPQAQVNNTRRAPNIAIIPLRIRVHLLYNFIVS